MGVFVLGRLRRAFAPPPPPAARRGFPYGLVALGLIVLVTIVGVDWVRGLVPSFSNPFTTQTVDRSAPVVLRSVRDIGQYRAATGQFSEIIDLENDVRFVPSFIKGERVLFVAVGEVDAGVDLAGLGAGAIRVSPDRTAVTVTLPPARLYEARIDPAHSYVSDRDRGVVDRVGSVFGDGGGGERELYLLAERRLAAAAVSGSGLLLRAERNTRTMLESMLRALGFDTVVVRFEPSPQL